MKKIFAVVGIVTAAILTSGCATNVRWFDNLGQGRGQREFNMDRGYCQLLAQNAAAQQQSLVNQQNENGCRGTSRQCAGLGALQGLTVVAAEATAMNSCLESRGWERRQVSR